MTGLRAVLESKFVNETKLYSFYFSLPVGVTISSAVCNASVYSGTDASPSSIINGSSSISGAAVSQSITAGTAGVIYDILCTATLSDAQALQQSAYLAVVPTA